MKIKLSREVLPQAVGRFGKRNFYNSDRILCQARNQIL